MLAPTNQHGTRLRKRYGKNRSHLFTFPEHPDTPPDNNGSERELRPPTTYRKVTGGFRSNWASVVANPPGHTSVFGASKRGVGSARQLCYNASNQASSGRTDGTGRQARTWQVAQVLAEAIWRIVANIRSDA